MSSIKKRIAELEVARTEAEQRTMTNAEIAVRATAILNNPNSPAHAELVEFLERSSEGFRRLRHQRASSPKVDSHIGLRTKSTRKPHKTSSGEPPLARAA